MWVVCMVYFYDCKNLAFNENNECVECVGVGREVKTHEQYEKHVESVGNEVGREVEAVEE